MSWVKFIIVVYTLASAILAGIGGVVYGMGGPPAPSVVCVLAGGTGFVAGLALWAAYNNQGTS